MPLRSLIVDDEKPSRDLLRSLLHEYCMDMQVVAEAEDTSSARRCIATHQPDVVFLDIEIPDANGFELLQSTQAQYSYQTVFVTAYQQYALRAIKAGAVDYILKPIDTDDLQRALQKLKSKSSHAAGAGSCSPALLEKALMLPHQKGARIVRMKEIIDLEAYNNYTVVNLGSNERIVVSKSLKDLEQKLDTSWFFRTHKSHLINFYHCKEYSSEDGEYAVMSNGRKISISRLRLHEFFEALSCFAQS